MISTDGHELTTRVRHGVTSATAFDDLAWAHESGPYESNGYRFVVRCTDDRFGTHIASLLRPMLADTQVSSGPPTRAYSLLEYPLEGGLAWAVYRDGLRLVHRAPPPRVLSMMLWDLNRKVIEEGVAARVAVHASCVARDGRATILAAPMESGKTTLAAGLLRRGLDYLTDEATMVDPETLAISPYPKALGIDEGSWPLFPELEPTGLAADFTRDQWHVPPTRFRAGNVAATAAPSVVLAPRYSPDAETRLVVVRPAVMVKLLADSTFHFDQDVVRNLRVLARLVEQCRYYRLEVGDLEAACDLVVDLLEGK